MKGRRGREDGEKEEGEAGTAAATAKRGDGGAAREGEGGEEKGEERQMSRVLPNPTPEPVPQCRAHVGAPHVRASASALGPSTIALESKIGSECDIKSEGKREKGREKERIAWGKLLGQK